MRPRPDMCAWLFLAALSANGSEPERGVIAPAGFLARMESSQEQTEPTPSPECLKGYLVNEQEKTVIARDGEVKDQRSGLSALLDSHALSFGMGCALGTIGLGLLLRGKASHQVINVSMPPTAALPASPEDTPVTARFRSSGSKRKKSKKTVSYLPAANFDLGPSFEEEKADRDAAEDRKAEAVLAGLVESNIALREAIGEHGQETPSAKA